MTDYVRPRLTRREATAISELGAAILLDEETAQRAYGLGCQVSVAVGAIARINEALLGETSRDKKAERE